MSRSFSIYLDLVRFLSAILVLTYHAKSSRYDGSWLKGIGAYGHDAVMVFFVLSGFVIAYVANNKESTIYEFSKSRFARLYSVVFPALIITLVLDYFGQLLDPSMYAGAHFEDSSPYYRFFSNLFFINEIWFESWLAFSNGPFWSLSYEFWFYVIFASWFYFTGSKKYLITLCAILIAGPKILMLFPIWLMGAAVYYLSTRININKYLAFFLAVTPIILYAIIRETGLQKILLNYTIEVFGREVLYQDLYRSRHFISDYIVGILVSVHLFALITLLNRVSIATYVEKVIRYLAGMTFAIYLLHYPFLQFYGSFVYGGVTVVGLTFLSIMLLAPFTEGQKRLWGDVYEALFKLASRVRQRFTYLK